MRRYLSNPVLIANDGCDWVAEVNLVVGDVIEVGDELEIGGVLWRVRVPAVGPGIFSIVLTPAVCAPLPQKLFHLLQPIQPIDLMESYQAVPDQNAKHFMLTDAKINELVNGFNAMLDVVTKNWPMIDLSKLFEKKSEVKP